MLKSPESIESLDIPQVGVLPRVEKIKKGYILVKDTVSKNKVNESNIENKSYL